MSHFLGKWKTRKRKTGTGICAKSCMQHGRNKTTAHKDFVHKNLQRGSWRSCTRTKEHNNGLQVSPTTWHSSRHSLGLDTGTRIGYTNHGYCNCINPITIGDQALQILDRCLQWRWNLYCGDWKIHLCNGCKGHVILFWGGKSPAEVVLNIFKSIMSSQ